MSVRALWQRMEMLHAVAYFAPESVEAAKAVGLRGFWMGYFGFRAAPLGPVGPDVVEALFANFEPAMVARSIPDAWAFAGDADLVMVRAEAAAAALCRVAPSVSTVAADIAPMLAEVIDRADPLGRPMFAANRLVGRFTDPVEQLWQCCTALREYRGDGHVAALAAAGVSGPAAHVLIAADQGVPPETFFQHRGWSDKQQASALQSVEGLVDGGALTPEGRSLRDEIEATTDRLAAVPFEGANVEAFIGTLDAPAREVQNSGVIPFPNPMGLTTLT